MSTRHRVLAATSFLVTLTGASAQAAAADPLPLQSRDDALTPARGSWSLGVFNPARYAITDDAEVQAHPLLFFVAPHGEIHIRHTRLGPWRVTGVYGLSLPSLAMRLTSGYLFPSYDRNGGSLGFYLVPKVGVLVSAGRSDHDVLTLKFDAALGVPLQQTDARPMQAPAPLDLLFAPVLSGYRLRAGLLYDGPLRDWVRWRIYGDVFAHGIDHTNTTGSHLAHFTFRVGGGVDFRIGQASRLVLGIVVWNSYQHAVDAQGNPRRSTDPLPVLDFIWAW